MARRRRRGEGSVYFSRSERVWVAAVSLGIVNGRRVVHRAKANTEAGAKRELERLVLAYRGGATPSADTLDAYLRDWLKSKRKVSAKTLRSYREHVDLHISPLLGGVPLARLNERDVERLVAELEAKSLSPATVNHVLDTLSIALNRAAERRLILLNPVRIIERPRVEREPVHAMTDDEADDLVAAFEGHWAYLIVRLLAGSALRIGEAVTLNQGDVQPGFVRLRKSKTTIRAVPISEDAEAACREAIRSAPRVGPNEPLFFGIRRNRQGVIDRLPADSVSHAVPRVIEAAGLHRLTPHGFRHGAATIMAAKGVPMRYIQEQLGHKRMSTTADTYAHVVPQVQREAVTTLNRRVGGR